MGTLFLIVGPSGSGKTTLVNKLIEDELCVRGITCTTRKKRENETDGVDYIFLSRDEFNRKQEHGFYEISEHFNNLYGTPVDNIQKQLENNNVALIVDVNGCEQIKNISKSQNLNNKLISIFIYTTKENAKNRLSARKESEEEISLRTARYDYEVHYMLNFDYIVDNNLNFEAAYNHLKTIILEETKSE